MTTMRNRRVVKDYVSADDRLRQSAGMGLGERDAVGVNRFLALLIKTLAVAIVVLVAVLYVRPDFEAWVGGGVVTTGRVK